MTPILQLVFRFVVNLVITRPLTRPVVTQIYDFYDMGPKSYYICFLFFAWDTLNVKPMICCKNAVTLWMFIGMYNWTKNINITFLSKYGKYGSKVKSLADRCQRKTTLIVNCGQHLYFNSVYLNEKILTFPVNFPFSDQHFPAIY